VFALRIGAGWVEIRASETKPTGYISKATKMVETPELYFDSNGRERSKLVKKELVIEMIHHEGGEILCSLKTSKFSALTRLPLPPKGHITEVPAEQASRFLDKSWRRKHNLS
jgi:hypothetical protein